MVADINTAIREAIKIMKEERKEDGRYTLRSFTGDHLILWLEDDIYTCTYIDGEWQAEEWEEVEYGISLLKGWEGACIVDWLDAQEFAEFFRNHVINNPFRLIKGKWFGLDMGTFIIDEVTTCIDRKSGFPTLSFTMRGIGGFE